MESSASQQLMEIVRLAKESAKRAEQEYDRREESLQARASRNIDLFGGHAVSQVADLAGEARKACDALYAAYQTLVGMTDAQCRPLLTQQPSREAVRAVRDLIQWLNEESEIENNFSASLNARDLGDIASVRYIPKLENKMIQSFWENTYSTLPGAAEAERQEKETAENEKKKAARQRAEEYRKAQLALEAQKEQYRQDVEAWHAATNQSRMQQATMLKNLENQERKRLEAEADKRYEAQTQNVEAELAQKKEALTKAHHAMGSLGFFQFGEKKRQKDAIEALTVQIDKLERAIEEAKSAREQERRKITAAVAARKAEWQAVAEQAYPLPQEPCPPGMTQDQYAARKIQDAIYETLKRHGRLTLEELLEKCPAVKGWTENRLRATLRQMEERLFVEQIKRMWLYSVQPEKDPQEQAREDRQYKEAITAHIRQYGRCTVGEISDNCVDVMHLSVRKVSQLTQQLYAEGGLHRTEEDRKAYFETV